MQGNTLQELINNLQKQIARGETGSAIDHLVNYLDAEYSALRDEALLLSSRYYRIKRDERKGVISRDTASSEYNRVSESLLKLLEQVKSTVEKEKFPVMEPASEAPSLPDEVSFEKIIGINNLKQISWIQQGISTARSICRILTPYGLGTGFLISPELIMTNNHVIPDKDCAARTTIEFNYQQDQDLTILPTCRYQLNEDTFFTNKDLDYTIAGITSEPQKPGLADWGCVTLNPHADPVPGEHVIIIQHPNGGLKQIALTANQVVGLWDHRIHYTTDTMPGSSGAPVFNDAWQVIAIHHGGGDLQVNAKGDRRYVNEGILISAIAKDAAGILPEL